VTEPMKLIWNAADQLTAGSLKRRRSMPNAGAYPERNGTVFATTRARSSLSSHRVNR
jgi:hypothetical protein